MRRLIIFILFIVIIGGLVFAGYIFIANFTYTRHITLPPQLLASSTDGSITSTTTPVATTSVFGISFSELASSTPDTSLWKTYTNPKLGFSVRYPQDYLLNTDTPGSVILFVPKNTYFHWPLLDDVKIMITASSSCPEVLSGFTNPITAKIAVGTNIYSYSEGGDVAAGNIYREQAYDLIDGNTCYHLDLFDHGSNGSGLYVSDQSLISRYDNQHQVDLNSVVASFYALVQSFKILSP